MTVSTLLSIIFHHALLVRFVTSVSCLNDTFFAPRSLSLLSYFRFPDAAPEKGECASSILAPGSCFSLDFCRCYQIIASIFYCVSFFQLDSLSPNFQLWMKTISLYSWRFKRKGHPCRSNFFLDAPFDLHLRKLKFNFSSVTDLNSKPCTNNLFDKATVDGRISAVKL